MRRTLCIAAVLLALGLSGCGDDSTPNNAFVSSTNVTAMAPMANGGLRYANSGTGAIYEVDNSGHGSSTPLATVAVSTAVTGAVTGLAIDSYNHTYASWVDTNNTLTVGEVAPGPVRVLWTGPKVSSVNDLSGRLTVTPYGRLLLAVGDLGDPSKVADPKTVNGKLLSLDPNGAPTQLPNAVTTGFVNPTGVAYSFDKVLWVADDRGSEQGRLARTGDSSATTGAVTNFDSHDKPVGMSAYGDEELVVCLAGSHQLKRYLLSDGIQALPERSLANDCAYGVVQLHDGRLAYATTTGIRVTPL